VRVSRVPSKAVNLLFIVEDAFQITGRGCILVPGPAAATGGPSVKVGTPIRLGLADGTVQDTHICGLEMLNFGPRPRPAVITAPILLPKDFRKEDVPIGTKVFLLAEADAPESASGT